MLKCSETDQKFPAAREAYQTEGWMQGIRIVSRIKAAILEIRFKLEPCISKVILFFPLQRQQVRMVPVTEVHYTWKRRTGKVIKKTKQKNLK